MLVIELFPQSNKKVVVLNWVSDSCQFIRYLTFFKEVSYFRPIIQMLCTKGIGQLACISFKISFGLSISDRFSLSKPCIWALSIRALYVMSFMCSVLCVNSALANSIVSCTSTLITKSTLLGRHTNRDVITSHSHNLRWILTSWAFLDNIIVLAWETVMEDRIIDWCHSTDLVLQRLLFI